MELPTELQIETGDILRDYGLAVQSREMSLMGRREVMSGKAKFGIFGDGKEIAQVALARAFQPGDFRAGYYRDQTVMMALGLLTVTEYFAQLYAHGELHADSHAAGRQMNAHFATRLLNPDGSWRSQTDRYNSSADLSPTGSQMPKLVGLGYASKLYRHLPDLHHLTNFSQNGNEVAFGMIGNASCAEGMFWEAVNAIGVLQVPVVISIWDDDYGISVPNEYQITKSDLSEVLSGFQRNEQHPDAFEIYTVKGWDYPALVSTYLQATQMAREHHIPAIVHVVEITQPQGHSTSGSHERYKSAERLAWEEEYDGIRQMRLWLLDAGLATADELDAIEAEARQTALEGMKAAWAAFTGEIEAERDELDGLLEALKAAHPQAESVQQQLKRNRQPLRKDVMAAARRALHLTRGSDSPARQRLTAWRDDYASANSERYNSHLYSGTALEVEEVPPTYADDAPEVRGFEVLQANFDAILAMYPNVVAFGEDLGFLGGVNQGMAGLQEKYGEMRVTDTGIREVTIMGQAIGAAMRGIRPIAEIQYLDYLLYGLQILSDDLATLRWRTRGGQKAPVIVRTRGHRLEGIWHSGSPMGSVTDLLRGMYVLVPRNMVQAAGFYNTLLKADEPGIIVEVLNAYRLRERLPQNLGEYTIPLGVPEIVRPGGHVTVVTYGALVPIAERAAKRLSEDAGIEVELIDVRSLLPFDINHMIVESLKKTSRILFLDEDVPGGGTAYMMREVLEEQGGYWWLDSEPRTMSAQAHRPPYGSDGSYFSKPNAEDIYEMVYDMMNEFDPATYPAI